MKLIYSVILILCYSTYCRGQVELKNGHDSILLTSRATADEVLHYFESLKSSKILYSLDNKYFYLIINDTPAYKEYYIAFDSFGIVQKIRPVKAETKTKKQRRDQEQYRKLLSEAEPIFDLSKYHKDFITEMPDTKFTSGRYSYFVIKDIDGERYGEYRLSTITSPLPINENLWIYLVKKLSEEISRDSDCN